MLVPWYNAGMPKRKTADAIEKTVPAAEPRKHTSATRSASAVTHKRTATKKTAQPSNVAGKAAAPVIAAVETVPSPVQTFASPTHVEIARLAYSFYEQRGYQPGNPQEDWLRAERELMELAQNR
jgi:hypothetical protein